MEKIASFTINHLKLLPGVYVSRKDAVGSETLTTFDLIRDFKGDVPGASAKDCGNYLDMNLPMANYLADHYLKNALYVADDKNLNYPE